MKLLHRWLELCERFDTLVVRERMLLFGSCLAGLYLIFDTLFLMPNTKEIGRLQAEVASVETKAEQYQTEKMVFDRVANRDPDADIKRERLILQGKLLQLESSLDDLSLRLVPSEKIPEILSNLSQKADRVQLKSLQTMPAEAIDLGGKRVQLKSLAKAANNYISGNSNNQKDVPPTEKVYRHAIHIQLEGTYFEIIDFLKELESLQWRFYWEGLDYKVAQFPRAMVDIELYTLSTEEGMLGGR